MKVFIQTLLLFSLFSCGHGGKSADELYSRRLQRQVKLTILHTPAPGDRSQFNLLILNDGQDMEKLRVRETMDRLSAFDIAWNHPDKISKVGVFSGSFWCRDKAVDYSSYSDENNRIMYSRPKASRKKPGLLYWFYAGGEEEKLTGIRTVSPS